MMDMKYKLLLLTIFLLFLFLFKVKAKSSLDYKDYNSLSDRNIQNIIDIKSIKQICSFKVCTYNIDNDYNTLLKRHYFRVINELNNDELLEIINVKGLKIKRVYFKD